MRKPVSSTIIPFPARTNPRRKRVPLFGALTCLVLVKHGETAQALLVSDDGKRENAVWCRKPLLIIAPPSRGGFLVATLSAYVAEQKGLQPRRIARKGLSAASLRALEAAERRAARQRELLRRHKGRPPFGRKAMTGLAVRGRRPAHLAD